MNVHYLHTSIVDLVKIDPIHMLQPLLTHIVLYPADKMIHFHIRSGFIPTKEIYGSPYPLTHLSKWQKKNLIFQLAKT